MSINTVTANTKYKDRLFNFIFGREDHREWTLSLYNAINGSDYSDPTEIELNTLKDVLFLGMRNDTSFLISGYVSVYEHQSSYNPNMPLRMLEYLVDLYSGFIKKNELNKYGSSPIRLPVPKLVVFYNGTEERADEEVLRLTDAFDTDRRDESDVEVRVRMININKGHNRSLMDLCKPLSEYAEFIDLVRKYRKSEELTDAVSIAIDELPDGYDIKEFLLVHRAEVEGMLDTEYDEEQVKELFRLEVERERREKERERKRAEAAEAENRELRAKLAAAGIS